jgi:hypothetical protein
MATAKQIAARKLFAQRAKAGTLRTGVRKRAKNPSRGGNDAIHIDIDSHNTKGRNVRAKNPLKPGLEKGSSKNRTPFIYEVQRWGANSGEWFQVAGFTYAEDAIEYAEALARKEKHWTIRVVDNYAK